MERVPITLVEYLIKSGRTYEEVSQELSTRYPGSSRGLSARSVRRYCMANGITKVVEREVEAMVEEAIMEVGAVYGRKLMKGFLLSKGFRISERSVANALREVDPDSYERRRQNTHDCTNPTPYRALYFGHKLHLDQNEKLAAFGITTVASRDGYSGMIVSYGVMPTKNNIAIYDLVYKRATENYGLWDQVRVDHGREFYLTLHIHEYIRRLNGRQDVLPYVQSTSTENMTIERIWPEVNSRVNYPVKRKLISLADSGVIDMDNDMVKFCVSFITCGVISAGLKRFVDSWNLHSIPRVGVPQVIAHQENCTSSLDHSSLPDIDEAVTMYTANDGQLQLESKFGIDPLCGRLDLIQRRDEWLRSVNAPFPEIFTDVVSGNGDLLKFAIVNCLQITYRLQWFLD